jgi:hypothetical protein
MSHNLCFALRWLNLWLNFGLCVFLLVLIVDGRGPTLRRRERGKDG